MNTIETENRLGIQFCIRQRIAIERGEGSYVWDESGREYLDFTSGWGVTCLGHSHPVITEAICSQAHKIIQNPNSGFTYSPCRASLMDLLHPVLPDSLSKLFFVNSGAEANDAAIKLARKITGRNKIVSTLRSFHGRTYNTLSVSTGTANTERYLPRMSGNQFVEFNDIDAIGHAIDDTTAAVIVEPVQGEGGVHIAQSGYLKEISRICKKHGALLIVDEIQTGFCRTGHFFAIDSEPESLQLDFLTMGKGIAGGFPFAAIAVSDAVNSQIELGDHGGTFCGNPLGCAVAAAVVHYLLQNRMAEEAKKKGKLVMELLQKLVRKYPDAILTARGAGLLCAIEMSTDAQLQLVVQNCLKRGLLVTPTRNNIIRLLPSLLVTESEIHQAVGILDRALSSD